MNSYLKISNLNDFIFCPISIYFHSLYENMEREIYQDIVQIKGTKAHEKVDTKGYSHRKNILQSLPVYSEKYNLIGKIDVFNLDTGELVERKKHVTRVYDGFVFQLYAQYFCLIEMGYKVKSLKIHSYDDNKNYSISLPREDIIMFKKFEALINDINDFDLEMFVPTNPDKCKNCIYFESCDRGIIC